MSDGVLLLAAWLAGFAGMGWFALAMETHWRQACSEAAGPPAARLRAAGTIALTASLALCLYVDHPSMAALVWVMSLAAAALAVAFLLSWRARWLRVLLFGKPRN
ncbi:DUF3325 domain-containing protein [Dokdonella sp.]|uniref:DUF3325 domain-containing protein n=1 Tax=Dokdonella sp. TaxID=2291710 RepID=UPI001B1D5D75|nr:DUF3325 domain-containing protein [Dokdonella sp.]MBO9661585.1 DUF3325 domain-containing protein [Dokdonella sp.]